MQAIHEAIDSGNYSVRIVFADFTKEFDVIDHSVLLNELKSFDIDQTLFFWVRCFLTNREQVVRVEHLCRHGNKATAASHKELNSV